MDYDADFAVVHVPGCGPQNVWHSAKTLDMLGYQCTQHGNKYRASPCDPMRWAPCKELYQQVRERPPWASRRGVMRMTAKQWKEGKTATSPHGSNFVDIEMYEVSPNNAVKVRGTAPFALALQQLFFRQHVASLGLCAFDCLCTVRVFDAIVRP